MDERTNILMDEREKFKKQVFDYVLMMLGAPVVKIELDQGQLDLCFNSTIDEIRRSNLKTISKVFIQEGVLARASLMLATIRYMWKRDESISRLVADAHGLLYEWRNKLENYRQAHR